ncbi:sialin [Daktulosphaira vitifoliae]|uniref:sialin n=1 Tax=Daktulosphaira vitifoliae TaxID=58002 RepID=UPI0021AA4CE1|nr:sialin [Daktulosphaira vitifoliae]
MSEKKQDAVETDPVIKENRSMSCTRILNLMVLVGFMVNYMLRVNFTITIVDMVIPNKTTTANETAANLTYPVMHNETNITNNFIPSESSYGKKFNWSANEQNLILGSFFWGYVLTELPGGRVAEMIGARTVFGYSMLLASMVTMLTPMAAKLGLYLVIFCRIFLGFTLGVTWPAILPLAANWIPPKERSKFMANMMASSLGAAITLPVCGFLISTLGWESVFYITGLVGIIWSILWFTLVFEKPSEHPRISEYEKHYIETQIATQSSGSKPKKLPWVEILTSLPVWAIAITHGCSVFGYFTIVNQLPTFMKVMFNLDIKHNGVLSSFPYLGKYLMAAVAGNLADRLLKSEKISKTAVRKLFTTIGVFTPGLLMILQSNFGESQVWSVIIFTLALTVNGAVTGGYLGNGLDIAPNFSGTIFGIANTMSSAGGSLSSFIVGKLTNNNNTFAQWRIVFWIMTGTYTLGASIFLIFGTAKTLPWNSTEKPENEMNGTNQQDIEASKPLNSSS